MSKWGQQDPDDDIPLDPENISEWYGVVSLVRSTFEGCAHAEATYNVATERFDACSINITLLKLDEFSPDKTWELAIAIKRGLRIFKHYWVVRIGIIGGDAESPSGEDLVWLEVDKYEISPYAGKVTIERFDHIANFYRKYWGTDFGFGV